MPAKKLNLTKATTRKKDVPQVHVDLTHINPKIPKVIKKFDPSYVTRYVVIAELVRELSGQKGNAKFKILDVGGYNGAARDLLPDQDITIIDLFEDMKLEKYVSYDGGRMPFQDGAFDMVISCDTLEHVPAQNRKRFLSEITRVTNNYLLLCAPFNTPEVASAELRSDIFYQGLTAGESYIWLKEHREYGLPEQADFETAMDGAGLHCTSFCHTSLELWEVMLRTSFFLAGNYKPLAPEISARLDKANDTYLKNYTFADFPEHGYRTFFVCSKKQIPTVDLPKYEPSKTTDFLVNQLKLAGVCVSEFSKEFGKTRGALADLRQESQKLYKDSVRILHERDALQERLNDIHSNPAFRLAKKAKTIQKRIIGR